MSNYTIFHLHSDYSILDSATKFKSYIDKAKELGMTALGFSEHGNCFQWIKKKQKCDEIGIKYIHAQEFYVTESLEKRVRDNWHVVCIAKNLDGVKELNKLSSLAHQKDGHFYYDPRLSLDELINTSDNIMITTACLGGILYSGTDTAKEKFIKFLIENKHRCWLEIQHHLVDEQKEYNVYLYKLSQETGIPLIAGTDTHSLNNELAEARRILQKSKNIHFDNEELLDLTFKSYDELIETYEIQGVLPEEVYLQAIENTNIMANNIEHFALDLTYKYPKVYEEAENVFLQKIYDSLKQKGLDNDTYKKRIDYELEAIRKNQAIDYLLLQEKITSWCRENDIYPGYSRGSVSGSLCAYLLGITEVDPIKYNLNFDRFMSVDRVSLSDIDVDYSPNKRDEVKKFVFNNLGLKCCDIVAFNTVALKGAIRDVARALEIPLETVNKICENAEYEEEKYRNKYPELFKYVDLLNGVITSVSIHPCGSVVSNYNLEEELGLFTSSTNEYPISQVDMKGIDGVNFVKLDILGLDNIQIINETCKLAGIERITPDNLNFNDVSVWEDIANDNTSIFQMESDFAGHIIKQLFNKEVLDKIKQQIGYIDYLSLFSMANGAIRPAGESYRDKMCQGIINDNGHFALNEILAPTLGYLVYQEQIIEFLNKFCGFTMGEADLVRRAFSKKLGTEQYIPRIKDGFIKTMQEKYNTTKEEAERIIESFLKVIEDASDYLFSLNHSLPYSMIGFACGYLRKYYTLEYLTVLLNINEGNQEKTTKIVEYAKNKGIKVKPIEFGKSKANYFYDKNENTIYKGCTSIKYLNSKVSDELYELSKNNYNSFVDLLVDMVEKTSINNRQIEILIKLNYFFQFGKNKKLLNIFNEFTKGKNKYDKKHKNKTKQQRLQALYEYEKTVEDIALPIVEQIAYETELLGVPMSIYDMPKGTSFIMELDLKNSPKATVYGLSTGNIVAVKVLKKDYQKQPFKKGDIVQFIKLKKKPQVKFVGYDSSNKPIFEPIEGKFDIWGEEYKMIKY